MDYPDFTQYSYIDIYAQTLGRVLNRPTYGGAQVSTVVQVATANDDTELISIVGEGMLYGGSLAVWGNLTQEDSYWKNVIDGNTQSPTVFSILSQFNMSQPHGSSPIVTRYDMVNYEYGFIIPYGITFEESFVCYYHESHGDTPTVMMVLTYALV